MIIVSTLLNHENVVMIIVRTVKPSIHAVFAVLMISNQYTGGWMKMFEEIGYWMFVIGLLLFVDGIILILFGDLL